jgi:hypothetical protein
LQSAELLPTRCRHSHRLKPDGLVDATSSIFYNINTGRNRRHASGVPLAWPPW